MRIRKRTPARAASPGPSLPLPARSSASPPPPLALQQQPKERPNEEDEEPGEKRVILVGAGGGDREDRRAPNAAAKNSAAMDDVPEPRGGAPASSARCSRNDGKRWRCKSPVVPGYLFCDRHIAWSTRKRKPRAKKQRNHGGGTVLEPTTKEQLGADKDEEEEEGAKDKAATARTPQLDSDDGFCYGGLQPGSRKRPRGDGPEPAA